MIPNSPLEIAKLLSDSMFPLPQGKIVTDKERAFRTSGSDPSPRRSYHSPEFSVYGTIRQVTETTFTLGGIKDTVIHGRKTA